MMLQFDDILLLFVYNLISNQWRNIHSGVAIIRVKIKTRVWDPMGLGCGTHVVRDPQKMLVRDPG